MQRLRVKAHRKAFLENPEYQEMILNYLHAERKDFSEQNKQPNGKASYGSKKSSR